MPTRLARPRPATSTALAETKNPLVERQLDEGIEAQDQTITKGTRPVNANPILSDTAETRTSPTIGELRDYIVVYEPTLTLKPTIDSAARRWSFPRFIIEVDTTAKTIGVTPTRCDERPYWDEYLSRGDARLFVRDLLSLEPERTLEWPHDPEGRVWGYCDLDEGAVVDCDRPGCVDFGARLLVDHEGHFCEAKSTEFMESWGVSTVFEPSLDQWAVLPPGHLDVIETNRMSELVQALVEAAVIADKLNDQAGA